MFQATHGDWRLSMNEQVPTLRSSHFRWADRIVTFMKAAEIKYYGEIDSTGAEKHGQRKLREVKNRLWGGGCIPGKGNPCLIEDRGGMRLYGVWHQACWQGRWRGIWPEHFGKRTASKLRRNFIARWGVWDLSWPCVFYISWKHDVFSLRERMEQLELFGKDVVCMMVRKK